MAHTNEMVAHLWAQNNGGSARSGTGNYCFSGPTLYSYRTPIAKWIGTDVCIVTGESFSVTTKGKHIRPMLDAIAANVMVIETKQSIQDLFRDRDDAARSWEILFFELAHRIPGAVAEIKRARKGINHRFNALITLCRNAKYTLRGFDMGNLSAKRWTQDDKAAAWKLYELSEEMLSPEGMARRCIDDIDERIAAENARERLADAKNAAKREAEMRANAIRRAGEITLWRSGEHTNVLYGLPTMLRIKGDIVQTSRGAEVPLQVARALWAALSNGRDIVGATIGAFRVSAVDDVAVTIGCHVIALEEIRAVLGAPLSLVEAQA